MEESSYGGVVRKIHAHNGGHLLPGENDVHYV
jgi:hypothetical protein